MFRYLNKKIDTAFRRLRERRAAVGNASTAETVEEEEKRLEREFQAASASGDIGALLSLIVSTSQLTVNDYVEKTIGTVLFMYYAYIDKFHTRPVDLDDLIDGILFMDVKNYIIKKGQKNGK